MAELGDRVERRVRIEADPATVFRYFTEASKLTRWLGRTAELDPVPGGTFQLDLTRLTRVVGKYVEVVPGRRLVFSWAWVGDGVPPGSSWVEVDLLPDSDGTLVCVVHRGLGAGRGARHGEGWDHYLARLARAAAGHDPGPDQWTTSGGRWPTPA